jgi:hypothetical protein
MRVKIMENADPELRRLTKAESVAFGRFQRLSQSGIHHAGDAIIQFAKDIWAEASAALHEYEALLRPAHH